MTSWTNEQLNRIAAGDELQIATPAPDTSMRRPVPVWVVRHGDALYIRSYRGTDGGWYRSAQAHGRGHVSADGVDRDVTFTHVTEADLNTQIDSAYRSKYARYGPRFLDPMTAPRARATTLKLIPVRPNEGTRRV